MLEASRIDRSYKTLSSFVERSEEARHAITRVVDIVGIPRENVAAVIEKLVEIIEGTLGAGRRG